MSIGAIEFEELDFSDAEKEVTVNENFYKTWWLGRRSIKDRDLNTPPGSPASEDAYLVATGGTGAWSGHDGDIAYYFGSCWYFFNPWEGLSVWIDDENLISTYTGAAWVDMAHGVDDVTIEISSGLLQVKNGGIDTNQLADDCVTAAKIDETESIIAANFDATGAFKVDSTQVVSNRITGWGAPTGTADRSTFETSSVTLEELAQRVKALIDDLTTHGMIGT